MGSGSSIPRTRAYLVSCGDEDRRKLHEANAVTAREAEVVEVGVEAVAGEAGKGQGTAVATRPPSGNKPGAMSLQPRKPPGC